MEPVFAFIRLLLTTVSFDSARVVEMSLTSVVFLLFACHRALGVRLESPGDQGSLRCFLFLG
jgi:hypothetical protein